MANIRVDVTYAIQDGCEIKFRSPVDCSAVTGLIVYSPNSNGSTISQEFVFADAHGNNVGDIDHLFAENVVVKVILDITTGMAFVQNADTNKYIEETFVKKSTDIDMTGHRISGLPIPQSSSEPATKEFVENFTVEGSTYVATDDNKDGNIVLRPYVADADELEFRDHIKNKNNPHGVTIEQIGAAPSGYGLGRQTGLTKITTLAQMDGTANCGWYDVALTDGNIGGMTKGGLRVDAAPHGITQTFFGYSAASTPEIFECKRVWTSNTRAWGDWEWKNAPMWVGVEYRTTERWNGNVVYTKLINLGNVPSGKKTISIGVYGTSTGDANGLIRHYAFTSTGRSALSADGTVSDWAVVVSLGDGNAYVNGGVGIGGNSEHLFLQVWYIKV